MNIFHIRHPADIAAYALAGALLSIIAAPHPRQAGAEMVGSLVHVVIAHAHDINSADNVYADIAKASP